VTSFRPGSVDYEKQAANYNRARYLSASAKGAWQEAFFQHLLPLAPKQVLDLGSGSGRFAPLIADWLGCRVVGVEPSDQMRAEAEREAAHPSVSYVPGDASAIPLGDRSCGGAWLAYMVHHVRDRVQCARELVRVLRPEARVLVAGAYTEKRRDLLMFKYFPGALRVIDEFCTANEIEADFREGGLEPLAVERVEYEYVGSLAEAAQRTALRADSLLQALPNKEFQAGQRALEAAAAAESDPKPVMDGVDMLVFRRP
jgi:ubiquinone/menaquinone biosynthesis C-methylase UbiE